MAGFADLIIGSNNFDSSERPEGVDGERTYFPESVGIYTIENPNTERRERNPRVISVPSAQFTNNLVFKGQGFPDAGFWPGTLYTEPFVINLAVLPANALFVGTDQPMFPYASPSKDGKVISKMIPVLPHTGVEVPLSYDLLREKVKVKDELEAALSKTKSDWYKKTLTAQLEGLDSKTDAKGYVRITTKANLTQRVYIPLLTALRREEEDENGDIVESYTPKLVLFEQKIGIKMTEALITNKAPGVDNKYDTAAATDYLFGDLLDEAGQFKVGEKIYLFKNTLGSVGGDAPYASSVWTDKINVRLRNAFGAALSKDITRETLERIIVLEMIGLYSKKEDVISPEGKLKEYFWSTIRKDKK